MTRVRLDGLVKGYRVVVAVDRLPAGERRVRMVFRDCALYSHLKVFSERGYSKLPFFVVEDGDNDLLADGRPLRHGLAERHTRPIRASSPITAPIP